MANISYAHSLLEQWGVAVETSPLPNRGEPTYWRPVICSQTDESVAETLDSR